MYNKAIDFSNEFISKYTNYKQNWNYEDGCVLKACIDMFKATGDIKYADFTINYLDRCINQDGEIINFANEVESIDSINAGKALFFAYDYTKNEKYKKALDFIYGQLMKQPRNKAGNFWHKHIYPNQVWLDGLYMSMPFYMEYETKYNKRQNYNDIAAQFSNVHKLMFDQNKELYYHAYDESRSEPWCNSVSGLSPNFWLRSEGWLLMSLADTLSVMDIQIYEHYRLYEDMLKEALHGILKYADKDTGLLYQLPSLQSLPGNYTETSGNAMVAYTILKACRLKYLLSEKYLAAGKKIAQALIDNKLLESSLNNQRNILYEKNQGSCNLTYSLKDICMVAGLGPGNRRDGSAEYYISEPIVSNDSKGAGPFIMMLSELLMAENA